MAAVGSRLCSYARLESGVHEFVLADATFTAVDEWLQLLNVLYKEASFNQPMFILADVRRSGIQPLTYAFRRIQKWLAVHPKHSRTRCAFLSHAETLAALKANFSRLIRTGGADAVRFFSAEGRDQAITWLLTGE
jgi:hypothetical protein